MAIKRSRTRRSIRAKTVSSSVNYRRVLVVTVVGGVLVVGLLFLGRVMIDRFWNPSVDLPGGGPTPVLKSLETIPEDNAENSILLPTNTPTPDPTPLPTVAIGSYAVQILNGNGRVGEARVISDELKAQGFNVTGTGNATRWDYDKTEIRGKESVPITVLEKVRDTLQDQYVIDIQANSTQTSGSDILIVLGRTTP